MWRVVFVSVLGWFGDVLLESVPSYMLLLEGRDRRYQWVTEIAFGGGGSSIR